MWEFDSPQSFLKARESDTHCDALPLPRFASRSWNKTKQIRVSIDNSAWRWFELSRCLGKIIHIRPVESKLIYPRCYSRSTVAAAMSFYTRVYLRDHFNNSINHRNLLASYPSVNQFRSHVVASRDLLQSYFYNVRGRPKTTSHIGR